MFFLLVLSPFKFDSIATGTGEEQILCNDQRYWEQEIGFQICPLERELETADLPK